MADTSPWSIRDARVEDVPFVLSSWVQSFWSDGACVSGIPKSVFQRAHHSLAERAISRSDVLVACLPNYHDVILGWVSVERNPQRLHYVYVKENFRRQGIARDLLSKALEDGPVLVTGQTHRWLRIVSHLGREYRFNPYMIHGAT